MGLAVGTAGGGRKGIRNAKYPARYGTHQKNCYVSNSDGALMDKKGNQLVSFYTGRKCHLKTLNKPWHRVGT